MSDALDDPAAKENQELAKVLNRINTLMGQAPAQDAALEEDIPQLTEVYEGEPLSFTARSADEFLRPNEVASQIDLAPQAETVDAILAELMPAIQEIIRKGVMQELENAEQPLRTKLESEILQLLRDNLLSRSLD